MFGAFSKLFKKSEPAPAPARSTDQKPSARAASSVPNDETLAKIAVSRRATAAPAAADALSIPYAAIIKLIPQELWGKLAPAGVAGCNYIISRKSVLEQLPHGSVKVSFGEIRRGAPSGVFVNTAVEDGRLVDLPLSEILTLLHPDALSRKPDQVRIQVSEEVPDLFGAKGERLAPLRVMEKKEVSTSTIFRQNPPGTPPAKPAKTAPQGAAPVPIPEAPIPNNITPLPQIKLPAPAPRPIAAAPAAAAPAPSIKMAPAPASIPVPVAKPAAAPVNPPAARPAVPQAAKPAALPKAAMPKPVAPAPLPVPVPVAVPAPAVFDTASFFIPLDVVAGGWPDGVRQELAQLKLPDAKVALPPVDICEGLKRGRIQYPWRTLRTWIQPTPFYATPSPHDDLVLELPLRALTPLFLEYIRANPVNRQVADASNITEFFRRAEQSTGTSADLLEPLAEASAPVVEQTSAPVTAPAASASGGFGEATVENGAFCLPLALITAHLPEPTTHDVASFNLGGSRFEIPLASIDAGLKAGRIEFSWRELCSWINPPSKPAQVSINGEHRVTLPLGLIAPLFMKSRAGAQGKSRKAVDESIPDLFSAAGKPLVQPAPAEEAPAAAVPTPVAAAAPKKVPANLSELFGEPDKKTWTPNEIVQRTAQLPGVAGALIALQDGLLVAGNMPPEVKSETIAAFVPQIFGRMNQYSRELQMGDTKAVSFTVEPGTIQVYNAGIIYFAALGKDATLLPLAELQLIAGELSRHTK